MADPYAGTQTGADGKRYTIGDAAMPTVEVNPEHHVRSLPTAGAVTQAAGATHVVPFSAIKVIVGLNQANDNPAFTFANPGENRYAEFILELVNADDASSPTIGVLPYVVSSPPVASAKIPGPASTKTDVYQALVIGSDDKASAAPTAVFLTRVVVGV